MPKIIKIDHYCQSCDKTYEITPSKKGVILDGVYLCADCGSQMFREVVYEKPKTQVELAVERWLDHNHMAHASAAEWRKALVRELPEILKELWLDDE